MSNAGKFYDHFGNLIIDYSAEGFYKPIDLGRDWKGYDPTHGVKSTPNPPLAQLPKIDFEKLRCETAIGMARVAVARADAVLSEIRQNEKKKETNLLMRSKPLSIQYTREDPATTLWREQTVRYSAKNLEEQRTKVLIESVLRSIRSEHDDLSKYLGEQLSLKEMEPKPNLWHATIEYPWMKREEEPTLSWSKIILRNKEMEKHENNEESEEDEYQDRPRRGLFQSIVQGLIEGLESAFPQRK